MRLHESIIWSVEEETLSGINIFCDSSKRKEVATFFEENFNKYWDEAKDAVEKEYGSCLEKDEDCSTIATVSEADYGVKVVLEPLYLSYQDGDYIESEGYAYKALNKSLAKLLNTYPDISYEGCIAYTWSVLNGGEAEWWRISSKESNLSEDRVFDFVGETLARELQDEEYWEKMAENLEEGELDDFKQIISNFYDYKKWISDDAIEKLMDIADEVDEEIRPELEETIEAINNGKEIEIEVETLDDTNLPDGYMDVLNDVVDRVKEHQKAQIEAELKAEDNSV